jgi:hypothetical protein
MTDADIIRAAKKQKDEEDNWENKIKGGKTVIAFVISWHCSMLRGQWGLIIHQQRKFELL